MGQKHPIKYAIIIPKLYLGEIYYKDIIVCSIQNDTIIGANIFDYDFNATITSTLDLNFVNNEVNESIVNANNIPAGILTNSLAKIFWIFNTEYEAFIQKLICLSAIRRIYVMNELKQREIFDKKIPSVINDVIRENKNENPEYFL